MQRDCVVPLILGLALTGAAFAPVTARAQNNARSAKATIAKPKSRPPRPPSDVTVVDQPNDAGEGLIVSWELSPDDKKGAKPRGVVQYRILRKADDEDKFVLVKEVTAQKTSVLDDKAKGFKPFLYQVVAVGPNGETSIAAASREPVTPVMQYFDRRRGWFGVILLLVGGCVVYFIAAARGGKDLKIRKIAGLEAVDEAVGRATEMGRTCLFVPGIQDINDIQTVAGITVLSRVAKVAAEYGATLEVPTARSLVMTTARETVESAFLSAGRPDAYREDDIYYLTDEQFGYVAGVTGTMLRKKPAACFYMGAFYAESLLLAETGNAIGAIQVAGTAMPSQLPFFVAACDYTLIGEEFFAASAYLSGEPQQLGSLKGQDVGKLIGGGLIVVGCLVATLLSLTGNETFQTVVSFLRDNVLGDKGFAP
jgi:Domain of unknown function (DUF6754)